MDSRNRDYLANERTFLAYMRSALAFIAFGFVIARFSLFTREISSIAHIRVPNTHTSAEFGVGMAITGIVLGIYGTTRYANTNTAIRQNEPRPMPVAAAIISAVAIAAIGIVVALALFEIR